MVFSHFGNCYSLRCVPFFALLGVFTTVGKPKMVTERGKKLCDYELFRYWSSFGTYSVSATSLHVYSELLHSPSSWTKSKHLGVPLSTRLLSFLL